MHPSSLEIRVLGPMEVRRGGKPRDLPRSRKARALLAYLVVTERPHGREHLCDLLWRGPADPRGALRGALSSLRPLLSGSGAELVARGDRVQLDLDGAMLDVARTREIAARAADVEVGALEGAAELFRGEFLEALDVPRCHRFEAWCAAEREAARRQRIAILSMLTERYRDRPEEALERARELVVVDPCAEDAHLRVMELLRELGRTDAALDQYQTCRRILRSELGVSPSREMEALRRSLIPVGYRGAAATGAQAPAHRPLRRRPLVGRGEERERLGRMIESAAASIAEAPLLVVGEAGIGKTRLLEEMIEMTVAAGGEALMGRAYEAEAIRPYGMWVDALRGVPTADVPSALRPELAMLLPELGQTHADPDRGRLFDAVLGLLASRTERSRPVTLLFDDLQWADEASSALLHSVVRAAPPGLLVVCAGRSAELDDNAAAARLFRALTRELSLHRIQLDHLGIDDTAGLVRHLGSDLDIERVYAKSSGNPLFALEIARLGNDDLSLSSTLDDLIEGRLTKLDAAARGLVPWAAALGRDFAVDTLARLVDLPTSRLVAAVETLERRGVLEPTGSGYDFTHGLVRDVAYRRISPPRRRLLHARIAEVLRDGDDLDTEHAGEVARHAALAENHDLAARAYLAAARRALWAFAPEEAAELAARGIAHLDDLPPRARLELRLELLGFSIYPGMKGYRIPNVEEELSAVISEARAAGLQAQVYRGFQLIAHLHFLNNDFTGALDSSLRAQRAGRSADPETVVRAIGDTARCLCIIDRDIPRAARLAREARALARAIGYQGHELPQALGHVDHHAGDLDSAVDNFERAAYLARAERQRWSECVCLSRLAMIEIERARPDSALTRCADLLAVTRKLGEGSNAPFAEALEALASFALGIDGAERRLDAALDALRGADSRWMIAYVQSSAARMDLDGGRPEQAERRSEEALRAAELVNRRNEVAVAHSLLCRLALGRGDRRAAEHHLSRASEDLHNAGVLSFRARTAVDAAADALVRAATPSSPTGGE